MANTNQNKSLSGILIGTETNVNPVERLVSATAGGALLAYGLKKGGFFGTLLSIAGGGIALRGVTGHCQVYDAMGIDRSEPGSTRNLASHRSSKKSDTWSNGLLTGKVHVSKSLTINKSPEELYKFWRNFENLPQFMEHLESVKNTGEKTSHWKAKAPLGQSVEWDAELTSDQENVRIGWKSLEGADVPNSGVVEFLPTSTRGTEVKVNLTYEAFGGAFGALFAKLFGEEPSQQVYGDLYRFKSLMESGEVITVEGQTSGREPQAKTASA
ncbi:MAG TPA: SRPBCC family protein [Pyrinomonadaceae bacterium]|nr:SRPBCC family protein [Pyrinomonadaceae bacterium]